MKLKKGVIIIISVICIIIFIVFLVCYYQFKYIENIKQTVRLESSVPIAKKDIIKSKSFILVYATLTEEQVQPYRTISPVYTVYEDDLGQYLNEYVKRKGNIADFNTQFYSSFTLPIFTKTTQVLVYVYGYKKNDLYDFYFIYKNPF